jgi:biopolymer transport protein ExbD
MSVETSSPESSADDLTVMGSINITPFVDVVLVLLVIFMVTAPMLNKEVFGITLPKASHGETKILQSICIAVTKQGQFLYNGTLISESDLVTSAQRAFEANHEIQALISADGDSRHADVVKAIDLIKSSGIIHFALQIEKP